MAKLYPQAVDIAVYQKSDAAYFLTLKRNQAKGAFIQLTYGIGFPNSKAKEQIYNSNRYLDFTGCYHFFLGNPFSEAKEFLAYLHYYGMDRTTPIMLDIEPNENYNGPQTALINKWTQIVHQNGYHNIFIYSMANWLKDGYHIKPENLTHGKIWAAAYNDYAPGVVHSSIWQYTDNWRGLNTDGNYIFVPLSSLTGSNDSSHKARKPKEFTNTYLKHGKRFKAIQDMNGYNNLHFKGRAGTFLPKGSIFAGQIIPCGKRVTRICTGSGYFSANTKLVEAMG